MVAAALVAVIAVAAAVAVFAIPRERSYGTRAQRQDVTAVGTWR
jgi:hypothetical protein